jgi:5-formyltetrahydrofolate cyclo-ligase
VDLNTDKTALRAELRRRRRELAKALPGAAQDAAAHAHGKLTGAVAGLYQPMGAEMDPSPLIAGLDALALPVALYRDRPLTFRAWTPGDPLVSDAFGIAAPGPDAAEVMPDLVIAPVLGFDRFGARLGQGAGHYDRTLEALRRIKPIWVVGLAYSGQEVERLPAEPHDQPLDAILTETGYRSFR